jgi:hypothetical protein
MCLVVTNGTQSKKKNHKVACKVEHWKSGSQSNKPAVALTNGGIFDVSYLTMFPIRRV